MSESVVERIILMADGLEVSFRVVLRISSFLEGTLVDHWSLESGCIGDSVLVDIDDRRVVVGRHHNGALGKILKVLICVLLGIGVSSDWSGWMSWSSWGSSLGSGGS